MKVKSTILLLVALQKGQQLCLKKNKLAVVKRGFLSWLWSHFHRKGLLCYLRYTFMIFCHEVKNPLNINNLRYVRDKTMAYAERALAGLQQIGMTECIPECRALMDGYLRASLMQERMIRTMERAVRQPVRDKLQLCRDARDGIADGRMPLTPKHGCSGVYCIHGRAWRIVGIFKPFDEEMLAPNNPSSYHGALGGKIPNYNTRSGEGVHREVAAYLIDALLGLNLVPFTCYLELRHARFYDVAEGLCIQEPKTKRGSFQQYEPGLLHVMEMPQQFLANLPFDLFHRLFILDLLLGNMDRHVGNLLTNGRKFIAIDHGLSLAPTPVSFSWKFPLPPQLRHPFGQHLRETIVTLPIERLAALLKKRCYIEGRCLQRLRERAAILQAGVAEGLTPYAIVQRLIAPSPQ